MKYEKDKEGFYPARIYFKEGFRAAGVALAMFDPERQKAQYNPTTGVVRAVIAGERLEMSIHGGFGPSAHLVGSGKGD